jgi:VIT1/CCC1 family predicted Fe2+/Mn2+ transporter
MSDGLTVPFALAAGLSGAVSSTNLVITAGLAEIAAGSLAMGLGGYLAARSDAAHYASEERREHREVEEKPREEEAEIEDILAEYGITQAEAAPLIAALRRRPHAWVDFMMRFELGLERPAPKRAFTSALTIGGSYVVGGLIPLSPYAVLSSTTSGLLGSILLTLIALGVFGWVKGRFTGVGPIRSSGQTMLVGGIAAAAAFGLAKLVS